MKKIPEKSEGQLLVDQLIYNELDRLSDLWESGLSDPITMNPQDEFEALKTEYPDIWNRWAESQYETLNDC